jgi:hypothetical protein
MNRLLSFLEYRPRLRNILSFCFSLIVMLLIGVGKVTAQDLNNSTVDLVANLWMLIAGSLVFGSSRLCVIIFAYGIVKCLSGNTFRTILSKKLSV